MTQEEKAKAYDEALALMKDCIPDKDGYVCVRPCDIFQELKESEDERIANAIKKHLDMEKSERNLTGYFGVSYQEAVAWLEKQGEQKPIDKVEPKFKVGDWIANSIETVQITGYDIDYGYQVDYKGNLQHRDTDIIEKEYHLWTIEDAKEGDVLAYVTDEEDLWIMIYWSLYEPYEGHVHYHALLVNDKFSDKGTCCICIDNLKPATKEQIDTLFQKMKENNWEWDVEKKELRKIEQKPTFRERYKRIADSEWFKKTHEGMSVSDDEEPKWTEEDKDHWMRMEKCTMSKKYSELTEREEAIYEIYSCMEGIIDYCDHMTSGNYMHNKNGAKFFVHRIQVCLEEIGIIKPDVEEQQ